MRKLLIFLLPGLLQVYTLLAQPKGRLKLQWQIKPAVGLNIPLTMLSNNTITDHQLEYADKTVAWQVVPVGVFWNKHWGIEFCYQANTSKKIRRQRDKFQQILEAQYSPNFYISSRPEYINYSTDVLGRQVERGFLGVVYRMEKNRLYLQPKLAIGVTSFYINTELYYLKEKKSNNVTMVYYDGGRPARDFFTLAAASAVGYKLHKRIAINLDLQTSWFQANFTINKSLTDQNTGASTQEAIRYKKPIFTFTPLLGAMISF